MRAVLFTLWMTLMLGAGTAAVTIAGNTGFGLDRSLEQSVSLRNESVRAGRPYIGRGLHGGK